MVPRGLQKLVQVVQQEIGQQEIGQQEIGQQWGKRTPLGRPLPSLPADAPAHHARLEEAAHDAQQAFVVKAPGQAGHQDIVVHPVEDLLQIEIDHDVVALGDAAARLGKRGMRPAPRAKAEARPRKRRVEDRLEDLQNGLLHQTIDHRRDAQLPHPAS